MTIGLLDGSAENWKPARDNNKSAAYSLLAAVVVILYFIAFVGFSIKLASKNDGFFIKWELRIVGIGSGFAMLVWFIKTIAGVDCGPGLGRACGVVILWISFTWMLTWSIGFPLFVAWKNDPRFSFAPCFKEKYERELASLSSKVSKEYPDFRESQQEGIVVHDAGTPPSVLDLSPEKLAKLKHVPLHKFLTYPPGREAFKDFTVREFSVENMLFIEAAKVYRENMQATKADGKILFDQFIAETGPNQVNVPAEIVHRLESRLEPEGGAGEEVRLFFEDAVEHVMKLMQRDGFKRFQKTAAWQLHVVVFDVVLPEPAKPSTKTQIVITEPNTSAVLVDSPTVTPTVTPTPSPTAAETLLTDTPLSAGDVERSSDLEAGV
jgi:hypothetical protein